MASSRGFPDRSLTFAFYGSIPLESLLNFIVLGDRGLHPNMLRKFHLLGAGQAGKAARISWEWLIFK
jgi:hypothetical protein